MSGPFSVQLHQFADKANQRANDVVGRVTTGIARRLDERSPVGDATYWQHPAPKGYTGGRFRGNWQLGIGVVPAGETGVIDKTGAETQGRIKANIPEQPAGTIMYLVNNVPYAHRIEEGWSRQAPQGLVGLTALEFQQVVDESVGSLK